MYLDVIMESIKCIFDGAGCDDCTAVLFRILETSEETADAGTAGD
jgi:hypothetical protein